MVTLACGTLTPTPSTSQSTIVNSPPAIHYPQFGVAGLIPRNFPNPSAADWINLYETLPETGTLLGVYTNWADSPKTAGRVPKVVETAFGLAAQYKFTPLIAFGFFRDTPGGGLEPTLSWTDTDDRDQFKQAAIAVVQTFQPAYLALGVEVNRYYEHDAAGFEAFLTAYAETYDAVKAVSPGTLVFPVFQLEMTKGGSYLMGNSEGRKPEWELLGRFGGRLDLAAFTTYPFLEYKSPAEIPNDYYAEISRHTTKPIAFTEIGWPSAPIVTIPDSAYGGSPEEQAEFVHRFFEMTSRIDLALALWSFPYDLGPAGHPVFNSISLRQNDGISKPALAEWQKVVANK